VQSARGGEGRAIPLSGRENEAELPRSCAVMHEPTPETGYEGRYGYCLPPYEIAYRRVIFITEVLCSGFEDFGEGVSHGEFERETPSYEPLREAQTVVARKGAACSLSRVRVGVRSLSRGARMRGNYRGLVQWF
jgi:hypothetical protein